MKLMQRMDKYQILHKGGTRKSLRSFLSSQQMIDHTRAFQIIKMFQKMKEFTYFLKIEKKKLYSPSLSTIIFTERKFILKNVIQCFNSVWQKSAGIYSFKAWYFPTIFKSLLGGSLKKFNKVLIVFIAQRIFLWYFLTVPSMKTKTRKFQALKPNSSAPKYKTLYYELGRVRTFIKYYYRE